MKFKDILSKMTDPLDDENLLFAILNTKLRRKNCDIRNLHINGENEQVNTLFFDKDEYIEYQAELMQFIIQKYSYYLRNDRSKLNYFSEAVSVYQKKDLIALDLLAESPLEMIKILVNDLNSFSRFDGRQYEETVEEIKEKYGCSEELWIILSSAYNNMVNIKDRIGSDGFGNLFIPKQKDSNDISIHINIPLDKSALDFALIYFKECIEAGIDYDSSIIERISGNDRTILYSSIRDLPKRIATLDKIGNNYPELIDRFDNPCRSASRINNSYYGISQIGKTNTLGDIVIPYDDYFDKICDISFTLFNAKLLLKKVEESEKGKEKHGETIYYLQQSIDLNNTDIEDYFGIDKELEKTKNGTNWEVVSNYISNFVTNNPEYSGYIREEIKRDGSDVLGEFRNCIIEVSNCFQGRKIDDKSNIAISKKMEDEVSRIIGE